jgi:hypothetical protein
MTLPAAKLRTIPAGAASPRFAGTLVLTCAGAAKLSAARIASSITGNLTNEVIGCLVLVFIAILCSILNAGGSVDNGPFGKRTAPPPLCYTHAENRSKLAQADGK